MKESSKRSRKIRSEEEDIENNTTLQQRQKSKIGLSGRLKNELICNELKLKGDFNLYLICQKFRAEYLLRGPL